MLRNQWKIEITYRKYDAYDRRVKSYCWHSEWQSERRMIETRWVRFARWRADESEHDVFAEKEKSIALRSRGRATLFSFLVFLDRGTWTSHFVRVLKLARMQQKLLISRINCSNKYWYLFILSYYINPLFLFIVWSQCIAVSAAQNSLILFLFHIS